MFKKKMNNMVIITSKSDREIIEDCILLRGHPKVYDKYKCIKVQVIASLLPFAETIIKKFRYFGLNEIKRTQKSIITDKGYELSDAYEIILKKIPILETIESEDE